MNTTAHIFLSYAREDEEKVEKLYQKLSVAGFKPWMDKKDILPGEKWKSSIQKAIRHSDFFLACLSANSVSKRGFLQKEIRDALDIWQEMLDSDIYLIPVRLEDCEVPESLRELQWVNLFEEDGWTQLVKAIQVGMQRRAGAPVDEERSPVTEMATPEERPERVRQKRQKDSSINHPPYKDIAKAIVKEMAQMSKPPTRKGEQMIQELDSLLADAQALSNSIAKLDEERDRGRVTAGDYLLQRTDLDKQRLRIVANIRRVLESAELREISPILDEIREGADEEKVKDDLKEIVREKGWGDALIEKINQHKGEIISLIISVAIEVSKRFGSTT